MLRTGPNRRTDGQTITMRNVGYAAEDAGGGSGGEVGDWKTFVLKY